MEAKVVEVGGKIISSVYIDEKSKSPEKLSSICYMSQCWHAQFMKTMSISQPTKNHASFRHNFLVAESHFLLFLPNANVSSRARLPNKIGRLTFLLQSVLKGFVL